MLLGLKKELNKKRTENGANALYSTGDARLDWFAECGSMRNLEEKEILRRFVKVLDIDKLDALKLLFYTRDVLAVGERRTARVVFRYLANSYPELLLKNLHLISEFGRWDDIIDICIDTKCEYHMIELIKEQLKKDLASTKGVSLLAKWLPSPNTSSKKTKDLAKKIYKKLGLTEREYRKILSSLRSKIDVVECKMSSNRWSEIDYNRLTSKNNLLYTDAFKKHDKERYTDYMDRVNTGEAKINTGTLFPYEIIRKVNEYNCRNKEELNTIWNNLPNYIPKNKNILCVVDVSGSMYGGRSSISPIYIALSLGLICARQMKGQFKNHFITFSKKPQLVEIAEGLNLYDTVRFMSQADWGMNTNLEKVFNLILEVAIKNNIPSNEIPDIVVISDMEIDSCNNNQEAIFGEYMRNKFNSNGYELPHITWWNVDARNQTFLASKDSPNMTLVSGASATLFDAVAKGKTPIDVLYDKVFNNVRYDCIEI